MKNRTWLGFPAIQAAALVVTASGIGWAEAALSAVLAWLLLRLPRAERLPEWMGNTQAIWNGVLAGQVLCWFAGCWPELTLWAALGLLILALWQVGKGEKATQSASSVLGLFQMLLIVGVLAAGIQSIKLENLRQDLPGLNGWLITILLLPALGRKEERGSLWPGLWTLLISLITGGVMPVETITGSGNAFWEMSRSITVFGKIRRLESLAAVGLSLGFYILVCFLLGGGQRRVTGKSLIPVVGAFLVFFTNGSIPGVWAAAVSILLWIVLPLLAGIRGEKRGETG